MKNKPCPFCGSNTTVLQSDKDRRWYWVSCYDCMSQGPKARSGTEEAREMWNQRFEVLNSEPDLDKCPRCGGEADNGHDRCLPPNPYTCSKCSEDDWRIKR